MRKITYETTVAQNFNDNKNPGVTYEVGEPITLDRDRYEELLSKGFVNEGKIVKEEDTVFKKNKFKKVEEVEKIEEENEE